MKALSPAAGLLATVLEIECSKGRDPNLFVKSLAATLEASSISAAPSSASLPQDTLRGVRAVKALLISLEAGSRDTTNSAVEPHGRLSRALDAVGRLADFCDEPRRGRNGACLALGCAAQAGRAWSAVRSEAEELSALPSQLPGLLDTVLKLQEPM